MSPKTLILDKAAWWLTALLLALLPFHAFGWTVFHAQFWQQDWTLVVQSWKEILVGALAFLAVVKFAHTRRLPHFKSFWLAVTLTVLAVFYALWGDGEWLPKLFGLRAAVLFLVAFAAILFFDFGKERVTQLKKIVVFSAAVVVLFALAQKFLLPPDLLASFGYSTNVSSWLPGGNLPMYHLVEGRENLIRLQSTFAGPNQLGAYLLVVLPLAAAFVLRKKWFRAFNPRDISGVKLSFLVLLGGVGVLVGTFSRSAWLGLAVVALALVIHSWRRNFSRRLKRWLVFGGAIGVGALVVASFAQPNFQEIFLRSASTSAHFERATTAARLVLTHPLGLGLGQTAGASQRFAADAVGITPENTFLATALELGWFGGMLFLAWIIVLLLELQKARSELFYALLGVSVVAVFLHPLEDAPTALTLFLLAGMSLSHKS